MTILQDITQAEREELAKLRAENQRLRDKAASRQKITLRISAKGAVSMYGLGRFPVTLYKGQWLKLLAEAENVREFIEMNNDDLSQGKED